MTLTAEARARLDAHLDAVEETLRAAGRTREERRGVMDDVESQALDVLARRVGSAEGRIGDVEAVLAAMDPPGAYGGPSAAPVHESSLVAPAVRNTPRNWSINMKSAVAVAVIICGTFLVAMPAFSDFWSEREDIAAMQLPHGVPEGVNIQTIRMSTESRFGFWLTGSAAIVCGIVGGFMAFSAEHRRERLA